MKFAFIAKHRSIWPVAWLCEALGVSRSGFHACVLNGLRASMRGMMRLCSTRSRTASRIATAPTARGRVWHSPPCRRFSVVLHRVERLMRANALRARRDGAASQKTTVSARSSCECAGPTVRGGKTEPEVGGPFLHTYGRLRAGSMWLPSSTCSHAVSLAGR